MKLKGLWQRVIRLAQFGFGPAKRIEIRQVFEEEYPGKFHNRSPGDKITASYSIRVDGYLCWEGFDIVVTKTGMCPEVEIH